MDVHPEFIFYGFCFGAVVWAVCRGLGYAVQSTRIGLALTD